MKKSEPRSGFNKSPQAVNISKLKEGALTYGIDFISILLISLGMYTAYISVSYWELPLHMCLIYVLVPILIYSLLSIRWWLVPAIIIVGGLISYIWLTQTDNFDPLLTYLQYFARWVIIKGAPPDEYISSMGGDTMLLAGVAALMALLVFIIIRRAFSFILTFTMNVTLFVLLLLWREVDITMSILLSLAGLFMLIPRVYSNRVEKRRRKELKKAAKDENNKNAAAIGIIGQIPRASVQLFAVPIAILLVLISQFITPADTEDWKSDDLNYFVDDVANMIDPFRDGASSSGSRFSLLSVGFQNSSGKLGGPISPSNERVLQVYTEDGGTLLRAAVYDEYTGSNWRVSKSRNDGNLRYDSFAVEDYKKLAFLGRREEMPSLIQRKYDELMDRREYDVTYLSDKNSAVFIPGSSPNIRFDRSNLQKQVYFNLRGEAYTSRRIPSGARLTVTGDVWKYRGDSFDENFLELEEFMKDSTDANYKSIAGRYSKVPENLEGAFNNIFSQLGVNAFSDGGGTVIAYDEYGSDESLTATVQGEGQHISSENNNENSANFVTAEGSGEGIIWEAAGADSLFNLLTPYQKAAAISDYLSGNFTYTLSPEEVPEGEDFVEWFLKTKEGYCTYFASAMVMMARSAGIPARYVTGFGLLQQELPSSGYQDETIMNTYFALNSTAHAWAELYFKGIGWVDFDPSGVSESFSGGGPGETEISEPEQEEMEPQDRVTPTPEPTAAPQQDGAEGAGGSITLLIWLGVAAVILVFVFIIVFRVRRRKLMHSRLTSGEKTAFEKYDMLFADIMRQQKMLGIRIKTGETMTALARRVDKELNSMLPLFENISRVQIRSVFGEIEPNESELTTAKKYNEKLEERLKIRLGKIKYFIKRGL